MNQELFCFRIMNHILLISGVLTNTSTVINAPTGMLSLPLGLSGNITQLVPAGIKSHGQLRASSSMPVFQVSTYSYHAWKSCFYLHV